MNKKIVIYGGGTLSHVSNHLAICAPAYGQTAKRLGELFKEHQDCKLDIDLRLTKMAGGDSMETNDDVRSDVLRAVGDETTKIIVLNAALCDFVPSGLWKEVNQYKENPKPLTIGKYARRLDSSESYNVFLNPAPKVRNQIRKERKDIFLITFKTTCGVTEHEMYLKGLKLLKESSSNLVLVNDTATRLNMIVTPEESVYHVTTDRDECLRNLVDIAVARSHLSFTRSTVVSGDAVPWESPEVPENLRAVVDYCISKTAYKPFGEAGSTVGHFAVKLNDTTFLTSKRKSNFNDLDKIGLVKVVTDGPDTVYAYGAKPSVGGQSQRIVFNEHPETDCIVHFHCPLKENHRDTIPIVSQRLTECGSHRCGQNTSNGLKSFGNLKAVYLEQHGPNIVFSKTTPAQEVIDFIEDNFDLSKKTDGYTIGTSVG